MARRKSAVEALALASILTELGESVLELVRESGLLKAKRRAARGEGKGRGTAKRAAKATKRPSASKGTKVAEAAPGANASGLKVPPPRNREHAGTGGAAKGAVEE